MESLHDTPEKVERFILRIYGKVQNVFFRDSSKERADQLGITGAVWNEADGSVTIVVQGFSRALQEFHAWCVGGPEGARVDHIEIHKEHPRKKDNGFFILYGKQRDSQDQEHL